MILTGSWLFYGLRDRFEGSSLIEIEYFVKQMVEMSKSEYIWSFPSDRNRSLRSKSSCNFVTIDELNFTSSSAEKSFMITSMLVTDL